MISTKRLVWASVMAALIFIATYILHIPVGIESAYIHLGDSVIIFAASILGAPFGAVAAALGSGLADLLAGFNMYILPTVIIKGAMGFLAGKLLFSENKTSILRCVITGILCEIIMVAGYFATNAILYGVSPALLAVPFDLIQLAAGIIGSTALIRAINFKNRLV